MTSQKSKRGGQGESGAPRAALYPRVSTGAQGEDGTSLQTQEARCRQYALEHGYVVDEAHVYIEIHTGTELWERPQLTKLREAIRQHQVDVLVAFAIDRLSRDPVHMGVIVSEAEHAGVRVEFVTEPLDNSPEGQLIRFVRGYAAKVEHEKIRERSIRGRRARADAGKLLPGCRPLYGYQWNAERTAYEIEPVTARVLQRIFGWAEEGAPLRVIQQRLSEEGVPTPSNRGKGFWQITTIQGMLHHPGYAGRAAGYRWRKVKDQVRGTVRFVERPDAERVAFPENTIPALVDAARWDAVQERLRLNKSFAHRNNHDPEGALLRGGYIRCGYTGCGYAMWVQSATATRAAVYRCAQHNHVRYVECPAPNIAASIIDNAVWAKVEAILTQPDLIAAELERTRGNDPTTADLAAVERSLTAVVREQRNLIENLGKVTGAAATIIAEKINALESQRTQHAAEREAILSRSQGWERAQKQLGDIQAWCRTVATRLTTLSYAEKRLALDALGVEVKVWRADHTPRYEVRASVPLDAPASVVVSTTSRSSGHNSVLLRWTDQDIVLAAAPALSE